MIILRMKNMKVRFLLAPMLLQWKMFQYQKNVLKALQTKNNKQNDFFMRFLSKHYYLMVTIALLYFLMDILFRNKFINWYFNASPSDHVTDAEAYANETLMSSVFGFIMLIISILIGTISLLLLFSEFGKGVNKVILIAVFAGVLFLFFIAIVGGSFR